MREVISVEVGWGAYTHSCRYRSNFKFVTYVANDDLNYIDSL